MTATDVYNARQAMYAAEEAHMADPSDPQKLAAYRLATDEYKRASEAQQHDALAKYHQTKKVDDYREYVTIQQKRAGGK